MQGEDNIYECTFVTTDIVPGLDYYATKCRIGPDGIEEILPLPELSEFETNALLEVNAELKNNIDKGVEFGIEYVKSNK